jgi:hypothetical protein
MVRVLLDEDIDVEFRNHLGEEVLAETVQFRGWKGFKNGALLRAAEADYDALITMDDNLPNQQNLASFALAIIILRARSKQLEHLLELVHSLLAALGDLKPGTVVRIYPPGFENR